MHSTPLHHGNANDTGTTRDNFDGLSKEEAWSLKCSIYYGFDAKDSLMDAICLSNVEKMTNHRFRTLTLPGGGDGNDNGGDGHRNNNKRFVNQLRRMLQFNTFYRPILQLHDILNSPLAQTEAALSVQIKLPHQFQRDVYSGALIALLPSSFPTTQSNKRAPPSSSSSSVGMEYTLMPKVLAFACSECTLDTLWNVIRYRPDVFCCVGAGRTVVECAPCSAFMRGGRWGDGCCIS